MLLLLNGCAMFQALAPTNVGEALDSMYVAIETLAETVAEECGTNVAGTACAQTSLISTDDALRARAELQQAKDITDQASVLHALGERAAAMEQIEGARLLLTAVKKILLEAEQ